MNELKFDEITRKYKYYRSIAIQQNDYRKSFCFHELLYHHYKENSNCCTKEQIDDLNKIKYMIFQKFSNEDIEIIEEIDFILSNDKKYNFKKNFEYSLLKVGLHIDMVSYLFYLEEFERANQYIFNSLKFYENAYGGKDSNPYQILLIHYLGEVICYCNLDLAIELYHTHILSDYSTDPYYITMQINIMSCLSDNKRLYEAQNMLNDWYKTFQRKEIESNVDKQILYNYMNLLILVKNEQFIQGIDLYENDVKLMDKEHIFYPNFCLEISNCYLELCNIEKSKQWILKGYHYYSYSSNKNDIYYKILKSKSFFDYVDGNIKLAIDELLEALKEIENIDGKNNDYILILLQLIIYIQDSDIKKKYWKEISKLSDKMNSYQLCIMYNNFVSAHLSIRGEYSFDYKEFEKMIQKANILADKINNYQMKIVTRLNYLRILVIQEKRYNQNDSTIKKLFNKLESHFSKQEYQNGQYYYLFWLCKLLYADGKRDNNECEKIRLFMTRYVLPYVSDEMKKQYEYIEADLITNKRKFSKLSFIYKQINDIHNHNDLHQCSYYLMEYLSSEADNTKYELLFECISKIKYLSNKCFGNYLDNPDNMEIARYIAGLETKLLYQLRLWSDDIKKIKDEIYLQKDKINFNYSLENTFNVPDISKVKIPDNACYIDFYFYYDFESFLNDNSEINIAIHLIENNMFGNKKTRRFKDIKYSQFMQYIDSYKETENIDFLIDAYNLLFEPLENYIEKYEYLYISGDIFLNTLPLEFLGSEYHDMLEDHIIIYVSSIFDIKDDFYVSSQKPFILTNPKYSINSQREVLTREMPITEIEGKYISDIYNVSYYTRKDANKINFLKNADATIIHLSSHGFFKEIYDDEQYLSFIRSFIPLAGYDDWRENNKENGYDNGLLTAQEIAFLKFKNLDLVVLSACESETGNFDDLLTNKGLRWAFEYGGAKSCITSIIRIDEALTTIFMMIFYDYLKKYPVAKALHKTKIHCLQMTTQDICKNQTFKYILDLRKESTGKDLLSDDYPFISEAVAFSFICHFNGGRI